MKKLVQEHPEIKCESYGFGNDRQLYLFKAQQDQSSLTPASLAKMQGSASSPDCSTATPSEASSENNPETPFPTMPEAMQVRNTFIHFEDSTHVDERVVQSMPRNMFRRCMQAESARRVAGKENSLPYSSQQREQVVRSAESKKTEEEIEPLSPVPEQDRAPLTPGALVIVEGLVKLPAFNGNSAIVQGWDEATGRYDILIACASVQGGFQQAKIKEENLRLVLSEPVVYQ